MKEAETSHKSKLRVMTRILGDLTMPRRAKSDFAEIYRVSKQCAAKLPRKSLIDIFPNIDQVEVRFKYSPRMGGGSVSDVVVLAQISRYLDCQQIFEIGTFRGYTTYHLALNTNAGSHIYTLDLRPSDINNASLELTDFEFINKPISGEWFHDSPVERKISQLFGDSARFDFKSYEGLMDFVYVDGGHSYEYAMNDSLAARRMMKPQGIIVWHDYPTYPGVWLCLEDLACQWPGSFSWIEGTALIVWQQK